MKNNSIDTEGSVFYKKEENYYYLTNNENLHMNKAFQSNKISSSKYNWITVIPQVLLEQFMNVGNIYFLILAILQLIPQISNSGSTPVNFIPLTIVVLVNGIKDVVEDFKRKRADFNENNTKSDLFNSKIIKNRLKTHNEGFYKEIWENIRPGDVVKIYKDESFPCDLVLLYSSNPKGVAYVETKSLDGETNLKLKESVKNVYTKLSKFYNKDDKTCAFNFFNSINFQINCDSPNDKMYIFNGSINIEKSYDEDILKYSKTFNTSKKSIDHVDLDEDSSFKEKKRMDSEYVSGSKIKNNSEKNMSKYTENEKETIGIIYDNILLRGSVLKQTDYVYAIANYVGHNTKIMKNSLCARNKRSKLTKLMNDYLTNVLVIQAMLCIFSVIVNLNEFYPFSYLISHFTDSAITEFIVGFFTWFLNLQNIIPISLVVTMEMIKFCQAMYISWDVNLYHRESRQQCVVQSSSLNEELGQIKHIFTDKTGTLTKNYMQFSCMMVKNKRYGYFEEELNDQDILAKENFENLAHVKFYDPEFWEEWGIKSPFDNNSSNIDYNNSKKSITTNNNLYLTKNEVKSNIEKMVLALSLCHTIVSEFKENKENDVKDKDGNEEKRILNLLNSEISYNASSPDELALVNGGRYFGVKFIDRLEDNSIIINFNNKPVKYKLLNIFEFNSDRKRMSCVLRDPNGKIIIFTKGADSVILKRLKKYDNLANLNEEINREKMVIDDIPNFLTYFGHKGLRTLLFAMKNISEMEYANFLDAYNVSNIFS